MRNTMPATMKFSFALVLVLTLASCGRSEIVGGPPAETEASDAGSSPSTSVATLSAECANPINGDSIAGMKSIKLEELTNKDSKDVYELESATIFSSEARLDKKSYTAVSEIKISDRASGKVDAPSVLCQDVGTKGLLSQNGLLADTILVKDSSITQEVKVEITIEPNKASASASLVPSKANLGDAKAADVESSTEMYISEDKKSLEIRTTNVSSTKVKDGENKLTTITSSKFKLK